ncbi:MAG: hypothetical protein RQ741_05500 [Wenzhouxiangellaceae bacterium]|nr:hypothetical protein [Wenzhouxiangellaceae bacterium]
MKPPLLIELDLVGKPDQAVRPSLLPLFTELHQAEWPLVLLSDRPDAWKPSRNRVDQAFMRQAAVEAEIHRSGGALDAIVYLDFGLFSRRKSRGLAIADLADRYGCKTSQIHAIVRPGRMAESLVSIVASVKTLESKKALNRALRDFLDRDTD